MMALQMLPILQVIIILCTPSSSLGYPVYGTKRYGRGTMQRAPSWAPYQPMVRTQRYPVNYYEFYPYSQNYGVDDYYYPQESLTYPIYYAPARTSKYEVYQAVLPYYYGDRPVIRPNYGYYGGGVDNDPIVDLQEEMLQEAEREEREEAQPIGQEMLYENENTNNNDDSLDEVNAAFLQNLIMSQMYKDAIDNQKKYYGHYPYDDDYYHNDEKWDDAIDEPKQNYYQEDEDVRELKQLAKPRKENWYERKYDAPRNKHIKTNSFSKYDDKRSANKKTEGVKDALAFSDRKSIVKETTSTSTTSAPATTKPPKRNSRGQKEEILLRPATPVRYPFSAPVLDMLTKNDEERKRTPSVYDTIKHMLDMEKKLENKYSSGEIRPNMRKRIVSNDETLTHQLSVLKKMSQ